MVTRLRAALTASRSCSRADSTGARNRAQGDGRMTDLERLHAAAPSPLDLCQRLGMTIARGARPDRCRVLCPVHNEKHASCDVGLRDSRIVWICRSCGEGGSLLELIAAVRGLDCRTDFRRVLEETAAVVGVALDERTPFRPRPAREYLVELAWRIDLVTDRYLATGDAGYDDVIEHATIEDLADALDVLDDSDELQAERDDQLAAMAPTVLRTIADRERRAA